MDTVAAIKATLGLDKAPFTRDLNGAVQDAERAGGRFAGANRRMEDSQERVLMSSHRVAKQIGRFSQDVLSGADATQILSTGLEGLERSLRLPLGALAGLAVAAIGIHQIGSIINDFEKLNTEIDKLTAPRDFSKLTLKEIEKHADDARKKIEELDKTNEGFWNKIKKFTVTGPWEVIKNAFTSPGNERAKSAAELEAEKKSGLQAGIQADSEYMAKRQMRLNQIEGDKSLPPEIKNAMKLSIDFADKIKEASEKGGAIYAQAVKDQLTVELEKIADKISTERKNRVGATLGDVAKRPEEFSNEFSAQATYEGQQARKVQELEEQAKQARERIGGSEGLRAAQDIYNQADEIRNGIGSLKPSELTPDVLRGALDSATVLQDIERNTRQQFTHK